MGMTGNFEWDQLVTFAGLRTWLKRVEADNDSLIDALNAIEHINSAIVHRFNELFDGQVSAALDNDCRERTRA